MSAPTRALTLTPRQEAMKLTTKQVTLPWAIYRRVSTKDQGEKYSPASQLETCRRLAADLGVTVPEKYVFLDKQTGKNDDRPDLHQVRALAESRLIGGVIGLCLDRVARNVVDAIQLRRDLKKENVALAFCLMQFDDSPQGRLMYNQFAAFAEYEAELILSRTSKGRAQKASEGKPNAGEIHAFGYEYHPGIRLTGGKFQDGYLEKHPIEAPIVLRMFLDYAKHGSAFRIQMWLNREGILTKHGNAWSNPTVLKVLRNELYTGCYETTVKGEDLTAKVYELTVPAIVSRELFDKVQVELANNAERAGRPPKARLLSSLIHCACCLPSGEPCKRRWTMQWKGYWSCSNYYDNKTRDRLCPSKPIREDIIDPLIFDGVRDRLRDPELVYRLAKELHAEQTRTDKVEGPSIEARLASLKALYERVEKIVFADVPERTRQKASQQLCDIEQEQRALEVELREKTVTVLAPRDRIVEACRDLREGLDALETFEDRREFILRTVERVDTDGTDYAVFCRVELPPAKAAKGDGKNSQLGCNAVDYFAFVIRGKVA